jgi:shikimate 5-dehydrogenase
MINKDTIICCSFAKTAGNTGCFMYNNAFKFLNLNYIYKSFSVSNVKDAIFSGRTLGFRGMSITMPFKMEAVNYVDEVSEEVSVIGATNTIVNTDGILKAYNTDAYSSYTLLSQYENIDTIYIIGNGGFSKAVQFSARKLFKNINLITRENWLRWWGIRDAIVFNCTPVDITIHPSNIYIDCNIKSNTGYELALLQASKQFELCTNIKFPIEYIRSI